MRLRNDSQRWGSVSIALHWLTLLMVVGMAAVGLIMTDLVTSPFKIQVYALHKSFGLTVLGLTALRLAWRFFVGRPDPIPGSPRWQDRLASLTHGALYGLLVAIPLSGWWFNSASGFPLRWFGLVAMPKLGSFNPQLKDLARETHGILFYLLATLVVIHAAAGLWHHYRLRDRTLSRMLPLIKDPH